ncbi:MAG: hypothetical protein IPK84_00055 [Candidatus Moraniibacteriota bacterium]|nr:MAG: hypothetical protein IPK84_00055 [Candidatus Moranbacteria bacterium]
MRVGPNRVLIFTGIFFQSVQRLGVGYAAESEGGVHVRVEEVDLFAMFLGTIQGDPEGGEFTGRISDPFGEAILVDIAISESEIRFTKIYADRSDPIFYNLQPACENGVWTGTYNGDTVGMGSVNMTVMEVPETFFTATLPYASPEIP